MRRHRAAAVLALGTAAVLSGCSADRSGPPAAEEPPPPAPAATSAAHQAAQARWQNEPLIAEDELKRVVVAERRGTGRSELPSYSLPSKGSFRVAVACDAGGELTVLVNGRVAARSPCDTVRMTVSVFGDPGLQRLSVKPSNPASHWKAVTLQGA